MAEALRKIELQEADDLRYLVANLRRAADEKIDLALPPIEGEDALRQKVEELVHGVRFILILSGPLHLSTQLS
jgi:kinetochor protein Mis14/NSL1